MKARRVPDDFGPVQRGVVEAVGEFCASNDPHGTLSITVETGAWIGSDGRQALRVAAETAGREARGRLVVVKLRILQRNDMAVDAASVTIEILTEEAVAPRVGTRPYTVDIGLDVGTRPWTLRVVYLGHAQALDGPTFTFSLTSADGWIPLGRDDRVARNRRRELDFGQMRALPSGWLIDVRCASAGLFVRRSAARPSYVVSVNGEPLTPGMEFVGAHEGTLVYRRPPTSEQTILRYVLAREWAG